MAKKVAEPTPVTQQTIDQCVARAVAEGDMVDFRFLFLPFSPLRNDSTEDVQTDKYRYLLPEDEKDPFYRQALSLVEQAELRQFVREQLEKNGPAQLPAQLVLALADNAVRLGKYSTAAQAYELLRIRRRMQEEFLNQADRALDDNDIPKAVKGYIIGAGLDYDYAAFPEPLPTIPKYQSRALVLHAEYPHRPEDSIALQAPEVQVGTALQYLLLSTEIAGRLDSRPFDQKLALLTLLIRALDPKWSEFQQRYLEACGLVKTFGERLQREANREEGVKEALAEEIQDTQERQDPHQIGARLLGRELTAGEWWMYLKELAFEHPASILFVSRQVVLRDIEIIMPRYRKDSPLVNALGMAFEDI